MLNPWLTGRAMSVGAVLGCACAAHGQAAWTPWWEGVGVLPGRNQSYCLDVSGNGTVAVGYSAGIGTFAPTTPFRWTRAGGLVELAHLAGDDSGVPYGISSSGLHIVGWSDFTAVKWSSPGFAPVMIASPAEWGTPRPRAVNPDGTVIVGEAGIGGRVIAVRWAPAAGGGNASLGTAGGTPTFTQSQAYTVSDDGNTVVGWSSSNTGAYTGFRWRPVGGNVALGLPTGYNSAECFGGSADGLYGAGFGTLIGSGEQRMLRWSGTSVSVLGVPTGATNAGANCVSNGGRVVGGWAYFGSSQQAVRYSQAKGIRRLDELLAARGASVINFTFVEVTGVSDDGSVLVGKGRRLIGPTDRPEGFVIFLPLKCSLADVADLGGSAEPDERITADDLITFLDAFFSGNLAIADVARLGGVIGPDGQLTADDIIAYLAAFFAGCP
ncbi:MAG: GC-type dockerin domain-anchored protein [Phycisphaerales bacterium]